MKFLNFNSLKFTAITEKNNKKIACFGFRINYNIGKATKGRPKLITPLTKPPKERAINIKIIG